MKSVTLVMLGSVILVTSVILGHPLPRSGATLPVLAKSEQQLVQSAVLSPAGNSSASQSIGKTGAFQQHMVHNGIALDLAIESLRTGNDRSLRAGDDADVRFSIHDAETGAPLTGLHPSAWMALPRNQDVPCKTMVKSFLDGGLLGLQPELDMDAYYVVAMNRDASITIADPHFSSGKSRLISTIELPARGEDWTLSSNQSHLYVAMPDANQVALINTSDWRITRSAQIMHPERTVLQPDEHYLWVSYDGRPGGVAVLGSDTLAVVKQFNLGEGPHDIALSNDNRFAFVSNRDAHSVTVIDVPLLTTIKEWKTGGKPWHLAFSPMAQAAYVTDGENGTVFAITAARPGTLSQIQAEPGLTRISFPGDGRLGFILNPEKGKVQILDGARNEIVQTAAINTLPTEIAFSSQLAYVVSQRSDLIEMMPLDQLGRPHSPVPAVDLPGPKRAGADNMSSEGFTDSIVQVPGANAVVIASSVDKAIYYYDEGMAAPMGIYLNFGKEPEAILVVDRSLREGAPGIYETSVRLEKPGVYSLPIAITAPPLVECFQVPVGPSGTTSEQ